MSVYTDIRAALESNVSNITNVPAAQYRSWENVRFEPSDDQKWIRMTFQPSRRRPLNVNPGATLDKSRYDGIFVIDVFAPEGDGPNTAESLADNIVDAFEAGTVLSANSQDVEIRYAEIGNAPNEDSPWYQVPVTIGWKAFS